MVLSAGLFASFKKALTFHLLTPASKFQDFH